MNKLCRKGLEYVIVNKDFEHFDVLCYTPGTICIIQNITIYSSKIK